ncbi:MAG: 2-C-methyl-D-erythritol 2,4-cyclodiphosphate synthase [Firmicutes bacterium]|nr:2-C-methyl-D-erythritol 2,4-cyclodiphosphate synthase [Bacillota bacterium]
MRVGIGYDVHRLVAGLPLWLGGVEVPYHSGLQGHSDGDVILHAIADALLGAAGESDIGSHFPSDDPAYKGAASASLLARVREIVSERGFAVNNVDAVLLAERPRIAPYVDAMRSRIAGILHIGPGDVSIKATTNEGLGFIGRGEGMAAYAVASLVSLAQAP